MDLESEIKKIQENLKNKVSAQMISEFRKDLEAKMSEIIESLEEKYTEKTQEIGDIRKEIKAIKEEIKEIREMYGNLQNTIEILRDYTLKYDKFIKKVRYIEEVIGVEEEIDVNKVPPSILQLVYQYTLNDIIDNLKKYLGTGEAERIVNEVLQDIRTRTSGTELFKFKDGKIITRDIERAINKKLISPKQVHSTYVEIVNKLREYIPRYIPKNFASLLRTKGQEYSIETATENRLRIEMIERNIEKLRNELSYQENLWKDEMLNQKMKLEMKLNESENRINEKINEINKILNFIREDITKIYELMGKMIPYLEKYRLNVYEEILARIPEDGIKIEDFDYPKEIINDFMDYARNAGLIIENDNLIYSWPKLKDAILRAIPEGKSISFSELRKRIGLDKEFLMSILDRLVKEDVLEEKRYGKGKKYKRR